MTSSKPSPSKSKLQIVKLISATPAEVFGAWQDANEIKEWLCPGSTRTTVEELDARVGGRFRIIMRDGGVDYLHAGEYLEIDPPRRLVFTWISDATNNEPSLVTVQFRKKGDRTELELTHEILPNKESADKHRGGWSSALDKLTLRFDN